MSAGDGDGAGDAFADVPVQRFDRREAENVLRGHPEGTFLLRRKADTLYSISLVAGPNDPVTFIHHLLSGQDNGTWLINEKAYNWPKPLTDPQACVRFLRAPDPALWSHSPLGQHHPALAGTDKTSPAAPTPVVDTTPKLPPKLLPKLKAKEPPLEEVEDPAQLEEPVLRAYRYLKCETGIPDTLAEDTFELQLTAKHIILWAEKKLVPGVPGPPIPERLLYKWPLDSIRDYGVNGTKCGIRTGRSAEGGAREYIFESNNSSYFNGFRNDMGSVIAARRAGHPPKLLPQLKAKEPPLEEVEARESEEGVYMRVKQLRAMALTGVSSDPIDDAELEIYLRLKTTHVVEALNIPRAEDPLYALKPSHALTQKIASIDAAAQEEIYMRVKEMHTEARRVAGLEKHVFVSYCWQDADMARLLATSVANHTKSSWLDVEQLKGGDGLFEAITDGIDKCDVVVCCLSDAYARSENCNKELNLAANWKKTIVPVIVGELVKFPPVCSAAPHLAGLLYLTGNTSAEIEDICAKEGKLIDAISKAPYSA